MLFWSSYLNILSNHLLFLLALLTCDHIFYNCNRFLWTTGDLVEEGWVPWNKQTINAAPNIIIWKQNCTKLQIRVPGLYR